MKRQRAKTDSHHGVRARTRRHAIASDRQQTFQVSAAALVAWVNKQRYKG
jgi:hypothetical protein